MAIPAWNLAFAYGDLFDTATITASSAAPLTPPATLQQEDVARKWRGISGASEWITATWPADVTADTFAIMGLGDKISPDGAFLLTGTVRLQLNSFGGTPGDVWDTGATAGMVDPDIGYAINLLTPKTFRSATWTFAQAGALYIEAGRGFVGDRVQVEVNPAWGVPARLADPSTKKKTDGGLTRVRVKPQYRTQAFDLQWITHAQYRSLIRPMDRAVGSHKDLLLLFDPSSDNLGQDSIWGLIDTVELVTTPGGVDGAGGLVRSRSYMIEERL